MKRKIALAAVLAVLPAITAVCRDAAGEAGKPTSPMGQTDSASDLFGTRSGYVHPFFGISEWYTDNLFNRSEGERTDFTTVFSPGIWFALPASDVRLLDMRTLNVAPGGLAVSRFEEPTPGRYQSYLLYEGGYEALAKNSSQDTMNHRAEGRFRYNARRGLSLDVTDQFLKTHDPWSTGVSLGLDKYYSNYADVAASYDTGGRLTASAGYSNYRIQYTASRNDDRDRTDNTFRGAVGYRVEPKTSVLLEYEHANIDYDQDELIRDSTEDRMYAGAEWDVTAKSRGKVRAGYGIKDGDDMDGKDLLLELQGQQFFTPQTSLRVLAARRVNETVIPDTNFIVSYSVYAEYVQRFTTKFSGTVTASYTNDRYDGDVTFDGVTESRDDGIYTGGISFGWDPRRWFNTTVGYEYTLRDSTFNDFDYSKNTVYLALRGGL